jgi:threonine/homoserine/homoserine lactone efflux protein
VPDPSTLALFGAAALALIVVPGPAVLYIVSRSVALGPRAGLASALGVAAGGLVHVAAAVAGLSALILSSAEAFAVLKYAGAAYLVFLGLRQLLSRGAARLGAAGTEAPVAPLRQVFWQGALVNLLNPKTALFFLAFLPQFVDPASGPAVTQTLVLGALFVVLAVLSDSAWALLGASAVRRMREGVRARLERFGSGGVLLALGAGAALSTSDRTH